MDSSQHLHISCLLFPSPLPMDYNGVQPTSLDRWLLVSNPLHMDYNGLQPTSSHLMPLVFISTAYGLQWSPANILRPLASGLKSTAYELQWTPANVFTSHASVLKLHHLWTTMDSSQHLHITGLWSQSLLPMDYNGLHHQPYHFIKLSTTMD